ncbi:hypothetical protein GDO81_010328 [Engystomops pustulosus]|uniref:E3 ubiquitin-protein ligase Mdm2 n=1 Tax=Engystomops pustulosus TaxID=76066 RepID=A0AAV7BZ60_ENGPU|nr:hypothetical protein GDO81_010328 [Engystomops pustulosus]
MEEAENSAELRQVCNMNVSSSHTDCLERSAIMSTDKEKLVRPNSLLLNLLKSAGAEKETFTMKEVIYHLGQYIMAKQLYDEKQQHIVHCSNDPLGEIFGVQNFSVKEPRRLYAMISKNLVTTDTEDCFVETSEKEPSSCSQTENSAHVSAEEQEKITPSVSSPKNSDSGKFLFFVFAYWHGTSGSVRHRCVIHTVIYGVCFFCFLIFLFCLEENSSNGQPSEQQRKRHKSDSISLTFDESLSWWVISGLRCDRNSSDSTDASSNADHEVHSVSDDWSDQDSNSDQFSVEFEVESVYSEDYSPSAGEESLTDDDIDDEVYQVTIYQAEESGDSFDEDTEISEADYWKCSQCEEMNPPIPRYCKRCWALRKDWLPEQTEWKNNALKRKDMEDSQEDEGIDVPDGKKIKLTQEAQNSVVTKKEDEGIQSSESQETEDFSQPSTSGSSASCSQEELREGEHAHKDSSEQSLPLSSVEPCVICQTRPKNGCIVHGRTGHLMACFSCAKKLKRRNKPCPVCRQPIQMIVLTYFS